MKSKPAQAANAAPRGHGLVCPTPSIRASVPRECTRPRSLLLLFAALLAVSGCKKASEKPLQEPMTEKAGEKAAAAQVPKRPAVASADDWCAGHSLPESMCTKCNPELTERFKAAGDWCAEHGLPESACPQCNPLPGPAAATASTPVGKADDWCGGHDLPESMCTKCNPELTEKFKAAGDWCEEHQLPESACPKCNPWAPPGSAPAGSAPSSRVVLRSPELEDVVGITTVRASRGSMAAYVEATARVAYDQNAVAEVRSALPGIVREVRVDLGDRVKAGDALFGIESLRIGELRAGRGAARARVRVAQAEAARQKELLAGGLSSRRAVDVAKRELQAARSDRASIERTLELSGAADSAGDGRLAVHAPIAGVIIERPAVPGAHADSTTRLATVADTSHMWALVDVPEWEARAIVVGQPVEATVDGLPGRTFEGRVKWLASEVDPRTRVVTARVELPNEDGALRSGQFGRARIQVSASLSAVTVPATALQRVDGKSVVFVRAERGVYEPRFVEPGRSHRRLVQVSGDLVDGELVVTTGAYLLRTELNRDGIGAGCCDVETAGAK